MSCVYFDKILEKTFVDSKYSRIFTSLKAIKHNIKTKKNENDLQSDPNQKRKSNS